MTTNSSNRIRIKDIAGKAGVSVGTVDRVLHNRGEVAPETREQVMKVIEELGYTPNLLAKSLASKKLYRIAVIIPDSSNDNLYWEKPLEGIQQANSEIKDYNARVEVFTFDINNERNFKQAFKRALETEPDGIVLAPMFSSSSLDLVAKCESHNIPYIFIDVQLDGCNNLAYFGHNARQSGYLAARLMYYGLPDSSEVLVVKLAGNDGVSQHLLRREEGFLEFFSGLENTRNIHTHSAEIHPEGESLESVLDSKLADCNRLKGIFVCNSKVHRIAEYLQKAGREDILLIGFDLIDKNMHFLENGTIDFLIGQKPEDQGYKSVIALFNHLLSQKDVQRTNYSPIEIIMRENIDFYKNHEIQ